ncbi:MAG TPA: alpha/beta hydrolase [Acidimicrobiales bacterium]|nr:alpha/beta hydrolase [Acidimicrobiales bacterium]
MESAAVSQGIVFIHGQPGSSEDWGPLSELLEGRYRLLAPDRPGWGANQEEATSLAGNAAWLAERIETWGAALPVTVVGHSLGGGIAVLLALDHPELVKSLVLLGSVGVDLALNSFDRILAVPTLGHTVIRAGVASVRSGRRAVGRLSAVAGGRQITERMGHSPTLRALAWLDTQPVTERARRSFIVEQQALLAETPSIQRRLGVLKVPTAVVHGSLDRIVSGEATRLLAELIPGAEWVLLAGEGHLVPVERPDKIVPLIDRYAELGGSGS